MQLKPFKQDINLYLDLSFKNTRKKLKDMHKPSIIAIPVNNYLNWMIGYAN